MTVKNLTDKLLENWPAKIVCLTLSLLLFMFYRMSNLDQRVFSAQVRVQTNGDLVPATTYPRTVTVRVRGETDILYPIEDKDISVFFDLSDLQREGEYRVPLQVRVNGPADSGNVLEATVEPAEILMRIESVAVKKVPVTPSFTGYPEAGYEFDGYLINPVSIEVSGPRTAVENINEMITEQIDLSGRNADFDGSALLVNRNPLITVSSGGTVEYRVTIRSIIAAKTFTEAKIFVAGLADSFELEMPEIQTSITVRGRQIDLAKWTVPDDALQVDAGSILRTGTYTVPVAAVLPEEFEVVDYSPREIQFRVRRKRQ